jgi:ABC-type dipeptide/oligopeptide/nickel transport system permease component
MTGEGLAIDGGQNAHCITSSIYPLISPHFFSSHFLGFFSLSLSVLLAKIIGNLAVSQRAIITHQTVAAYACSLQYL